ncbi:trypsin, alkaline C-like [Helicoverpa zea]|uniref:trypsin, alkaline C-like n=1 Tax=Helicoverpa zea TaxID=7113 RepID=UPI001F59E930|nr:trypsin, alkaline C-like [Helicoverpa zea]
MNRNILIILYLSWCCVGANTESPITLKEYLRKVALVIVEVVEGMIRNMHTEIDPFPILAQVFKYDVENKQFQQECAGVIVTNYHALSAAHCFPMGMDVNYWKVRVGSSYRSSGGVIHNVRAIRVHENYEELENTNDIAIMAMVEPFIFNSNVRKASIPIHGLEFDYNFECTLVGWGELQLGGLRSDKLELTKLVTVGQHDCTRKYETISKVIQNSMICAVRVNNGGSAGCKGDSGGPLIYNGFIVGIVSFGVSCQNPDFPGVYTKVSHYTDWMKRTVLAI